MLWLEYIKLKKFSIENCKISVKFPEKRQGKTTFKMKLFGLMLQHAL
jgi:hypothetical protein